MRSGRKAERRGEETLDGLPVSHFLAEVVEVPVDRPVVEEPLLGLGKGFRRMLGAFHLDKLSHFRWYREQAVRQFLGWLALEVQGGVVQRESQHGGRPSCVQSKYAPSPCLPLSQGGGAAATARNGLTTRTPS